MTNKCPVIEFDHRTKEFSTNKHTILKPLRQSSPIAYTNSYGGHWVVTSHALAQQVLKDPETFSSKKLPDGSGGVTIPTIPGKLLPAETDPPYHTQLRKKVASAYSPTAIDALMPMIKKTVSEAIDDVIKKGSFDIVDDIAEIVPALVGLRHLGFPEQERSEMVTMVKMALAADTPSEDAQSAFQGACGKMLGFVAERKQNPCGDFMSDIVGDKNPELSDEDLMWFGITLFVGGFKNPGAHISNMLLHLSEDTELRDRLIADRGLIRKANEEFMRFYTAGVSVARTITKDTDLGGAQLLKGERILVVLPSVNRDESIFSDSDVFDIDRKSNMKHMALGGGPHFCAGALLARVMFDALLNEIFDRIPNYSADASKAVQVDDGGIQAGYTTIPAVTGL